MPENKIDDQNDLRGAELLEPSGFEADGEKIMEEPAGNTESFDLPGGFAEGPDSEFESGHGPDGTEPVELTAAERDALGEVGNICMGSAATTLSTLTNQPVNITSPQVNLTTLNKLFKSFGIPHLAIHVRFIGGLSGYNILIMKLDDATVLADLMMGGDGANVSEELSEIGVSAASEAMNQMIGTASTSMAALFGKKVNISPPDTNVYYSEDEPRSPGLDYQGTVVVVRFNITIGTVLNTHIMQVMGVETAKEQAGALLRQLSAGSAGDTVKEKASEPSQKIKVKSEDEVKSVQNQDDMDLITGGESQKGPDPPAGVSKGPDATPLEEMELRALPGNGRKLVGGAPAAVLSALNQQHLDLILDIPLKVTVLLGRTKWPIKDILGVAPGSVVELHNQVDDPVEVLVNGTLVAMGEVVIVNENFGVRITNIIGPEDRLKHLGR